MKKSIFGLGLALALVFLPGLVKAASVPEPLAPKNNASSYHANTTFLQWSIIPGKSYILQIKKGDANFASIDETKKAIEENYILASEVKTDNLKEGIKNDGGTYYWRVRTEETGTAWSQTFKFSTIGAAQASIIRSPKVSKGVLPIVDLNKKETIFSWSTKAGTMYSVIEIYDAKKDGTIWKCGETQLFSSPPVYTETNFSSMMFQSYGINSSAANEAYCWKVKSFNNAGKSISSAPEFFIFKTYDGASLLKVNPLFAQFNFNQVLLYWTKAQQFGSEADKYTVKVSTASNMDKPVTVTTETNYLLDGSKDIYKLFMDNSGKDIYWQVKAGERGVWSKVSKFRSQPLGKAVLSAPAEKASGLATTTTFSWNKGLGTPNFYKLEFKKDGPNEPIKFYTTNRSYKPTASTIFPTGTYTWTVTAYNNNTASQVSDSRTFIQN